MIFTLPKPVSVNQLYKYTCRSGYARSYISDKGQEWILEAGALLNSQFKRKTPIKTDISVYIKLYVCGRSDIDNFNKALFDLFMKCGVIEDDSQINFLQIEKIAVKHRTDEKVEIEISY